MKQSKYNFFYELDGEDDILAYNSRTTALAVLERENFDSLRESKVIEQLNEKLVKDLKYGGFLIEDELDELQVLRYELFSSRFSDNWLSLVIAPTSDCNFRCPYCYEKDVLHTQRMTDEVAGKIVNLVESKAGTVAQMDVVWYGGEPLLEYDRILALSSRFLEICQKYEIRYNAVMVTNGYLLSVDKLKKLMECKVSSFQITLDGTKDTHNGRRYLKGHGATFDKIVGNLLSFQELAQQTEQFPGISVRMNIDKSNKNEAFELLEMIAGSSMASYVYPYVAGVFDANDLKHETTLTNYDYLELKNEFLKKCDELGFLTSYQSYYPVRITSSCCSDRIDSLIIDAHGKLYRCWEEMGDEQKCIGSLGEEKPGTWPKLYYDYMLKDPTSQEECKNCEILPVCMGGGCPHRRTVEPVDCDMNRRMIAINVKKSAEKFGKKISRRVII